MKEIIAALITLFCFTPALHTNHAKIRLLNDTLRGAVADAMERFWPAGEEIVISHHLEKDRFIKTYRSLPQGFHKTATIILYRSDEDRSIRSIAGEILEYTDYYHVSELTRAIQTANGISGDKVASGRTVLIPDPLPSLMPDISAKRKKNTAALCGLYFTGSSAGSGGFLRLIPRLKELGLNAVVFDAKDITGIVNYKSSAEGVRRLHTDEKRTIHNIRKLIRDLKSGNIHIIARVAAFQDHLLVKKDPGYAIRSRSSGGVWNKGNGEIWMDPTKKCVQEYVLSIARELSDLGVDEIQFDYIRFPTTGNLGDAAFAYEFGTMSHQQVITGFLKRAYNELGAKNTMVSIDIFGVVAWGKEIDIRQTGQDIAQLSQYCDVISPMLYPSHFSNDFDGYPNPGDHPYHFIYEGCKKVMELSSGKKAVRPWLQAFRWRVSSYNASYIQQQVKASKDSGAAGYLFWNAANDYKTVVKGLNGLE